jgi:PsbN protein
VAFLAGARKKVGQQLMKLAPNDGGKNFAPHLFALLGFCQGLSHFRGSSLIVRHSLQRSDFFWYLVMETPAFFYAVFLWFLLLSVTGYSIYVGFGPPSKELRDPFEDHED